MMSQAQPARRRKKNEDAARAARARELQEANVKLLAPKIISTDQRPVFDPFAEELLPETVAPKAERNGTKISIGANGKVGLSGPSRVGASGAGRANGATESRTATSSAAFGSGPSRIQIQRKTSPPPLNRKARQRQAFANELKKSAKQGSVFSVQHLVDEEGYGPPPAGLSRPGSRSPLPGNGSGSKDVVTSLKPARVAVDSRGLLKLRPDEGNRYKSLEAVQRDRSGAGSSSRGPLLHPPSKDRAGPSSAVARATSPPKPARAKPPLPPVASSARAAPAPAPRSPKRRARPHSSSPSSSADSGSSPPPSRPRTAKRYRSASPAARAGIDVSAEIRAMFARPGRAPPRAGWESDEEGSDDMEAGLSDLEEEERRAARIARLEDRKEEMEEQRRAEDKARKKTGKKGAR